MARDLCYFYNFLTIGNIKIYELDKDWIAEFINYLTKMDIARNKYAIENRLLTKIPLCTKYKCENNIIISKFRKINNKSIYRVFDRIINYLVYLQKEGKLYI